MDTIKNMKSNFQKNNEDQVASLATDLHTSLSDNNIRPPQSILSMNREQVFKLIKYLISSPKWNSDPHTLQNLISSAILPTSRPEPDFSSIRDAAGEGGCRGVCGKVWQEEGIGYKCKTCERDPTCVVCVQCFRNGDHTGHDYSISKTRVGCCDCGDIQAWDPKGFCSRHKGASREDENPDLLIPQPLRDRLLGAVEAMISVCLTTIVFEFCRIHQFQTYNYVPPILASTYLKWITDIARCGDGFSRAIGLIFTSDENRPWVTIMRNHLSQVSNPADRIFYSKPRTCLELFLHLDGMNQLPTELQSTLHNAYFQLITDITFKRSFLDGFIDNYASYIRIKLQLDQNPTTQHNEDDQSNDDIVEKFSVQLFTVPVLIPAMIREGGLLDELLNVILNLMEVSSSPVSSYKNSASLEDSEFINNDQKFRHRKFVDALTIQEGQDEVLNSPKVSKRKRCGLPVLLSRPDQKLVFPSWEPGSEQDTVQYVASSSNMSAKYEVSSIENSEDNTVLNNEEHPTLDRTSISPQGNSATVDPINTQPSISNERTTNITLYDEDEEEQSQDEDFEEEEDSSHSDSNPESEDPMDVEDDMQVVAELPDPENFPDPDDPISILPFNADQIILNTEDVNLTEIGYYNRATRRSSNGLREPRRAQLEMFEEGLRSNVSEPLSDRKESMFRAGIRQARSMADAAIDGTGPLAHPLRIDFVRHHDLEKECARVIRDIAFVLTHDLVAFYVVHVRQDLLRKIIRIFSITQGMSPRSRKFGNHVSMESTDSDNGIKLEVTLTAIATPLIAAFINDLSKLKDTAGLMSKFSADLQISQTRRDAIRIIHTCLNDWLEREEILEALTTHANEEFSVSHSFSIHLPLHRIFSIFIHHYIRLGHGNIKDLFLCIDSLTTDVSVQAKRVLLHPLRAQAYLAQVKAGMWVKNGRLGGDHLFLYSYPLWSQWYIDLDLFIQQCCVLVLEPEIFVKEALREFRIRDFQTAVSFSQRRPRSESSPDEPDADHTLANENLEESEIMNSDGVTRNTVVLSNAAMQTGLLPCAPKFIASSNILSDSDIREIGNSSDDLSNIVPTLIDEFMLFLVRVVCERTRSGESKNKYLRKRLLHQLAVDDKRHSKLYGTLPHSLLIDLFEESSSLDDPQANESEVDDILSKIANHVQPRGMTEGMYKLRDQYWVEFDHFTPLMTSFERNAAEIRYASVCRKQNKTPQIIPTLSMRERQTFDQFKDLESLARYICNSRPLGIVSTFLNELLRASNVSFKIEGSLFAALYLTRVSIELRNNHEESLVIKRTDSTKKEEFDNSAISMVCKIHEKYLKAKNGSWFGEISSVLQQILEETYKVGSSDLRKFLRLNSSHIQRMEGISKKVLGDRATMDPEAERKKRLQTLKRERQAAALASMRRAQAQFAEHISALDAEENSEESPTDEPKKQIKSNTAIEHSKGSQNLESVLSEDRLNCFALESKTTVVGEVCALCHVGSELGDQKHLGMIGFYQVGNLAKVASNQCCDATKEHEIQIQSRSRVAGSSANCSSQSSCQDMVDESIIGEDSARIEATARDELLRRMGFRNFFPSSHLTTTKVLEISREKYFPHLSFCGHFLHLECLDRFLATKRRSRSTNLDGDEGRIERKYPLFWCPACRRLANIILPTALQQPCSEPSSMYKQSREISFQQWKTFLTQNLRTQLNRDVEMDDNHGSDDTFPNNALITSDNHLLEQLQTKDREGKLGLHLFGFSTLSELITLQNLDPHAQEKRIMRPFPLLPFALLSTIMCMEISSRSIAWNDESFSRTRHTLTHAIREIRYQLKLRKSLNELSIKELWTLAATGNLSLLTDRFTVLFLLTMLWSDPFDFVDARRLVRFCLELVPQAKNPRYLNNGEHAMFNQDHLLYLRQATVLLAILFNALPENPLQTYRVNDRKGYTDIDIECKQLLQQLKLPSTNTISPLTPIPSSRETTFASRLSFWPKRIGLIRLPDTYQNLLDSLEGKTCVICCTATRLLALCLVCGALVCTEKCNVCPMSPILRHAAECGARIGLFLHVKNTEVQVIRRERETVWGSPYLDAHGEEDKDLNRGRPLFLCEDRYSILERLWLFMALDQDSRILRGTQFSVFPI